METWNLYKVCDKSNNENSVVEFEEAEVIEVIFLFTMSLYFVDMTWAEFGMKQQN